MKHLQYVDFYRQDLRTPCKQGSGWFSMLLFSIISRFCQVRALADAIQISRLILPGESPTPLRINVDGEAGTGKSHLIAVLSKTLSDMGGRAGKPMALLRAAPTGVAAFNIDGRTTFSLLKLPVQRAFKPLPAASLTSLQE